MSPAEDAAGSAVSPGGGGGISAAGAGGRSPKSIFCPGNGTGMISGRAVWGHATTVFSAVLDPAAVSPNICPGKGTGAEAGS